jgi:hypothetical protein
VSTPGDRDESGRPEKAEFDQAELDRAEPERAKPEQQIMPTAAEAKAQATADPTPRPVQYGIGMLFASAVLGVLVSILVLVTRQSQIDYLVQHPPAPKLTYDDIATSVTIQAVLLIVAAVINAAFIWLFAMKVRIGDRKSRTRLTVVVLLLGLFQYIFGIRIGALGVLIGIIGLVLLYVPSVKSFFAKR